MTTTRGASFLRQLAARRGSAVALEKARGGTKRTRRARRVKVRPQRQPDHLRRVYSEAIAKVAAAARDDVRRRLFPLGPSLVEDLARLHGDALRTDAPAASVSRLFGDLARDFFAEFTPEKIAAVVRKIGLDVSDFQRHEIARQFERAIGFDPFRLGETWLPTRIETFTAENVALIRTVPERYFADIETNLIRELRAGTRWEEIAPILEDRFGVSESNAGRIARDQVGKFYGELNRVRQQDVGVVSYTWRTARDNRVRDAHDMLEGSAFTWESGGDPIEGNPGEPINCRCQAEPDMGPILAALGD